MMGSSKTRSILYGVAAASSMLFGGIASATLSAEDQSTIAEAVGAALAQKFSPVVIQNPTGDVETRAREYKTLPAPVKASNRFNDDEEVKELFYRFDIGVQDLQGIMNELKVSNTLEGWMYDRAMITVRSLQKLEEEMTAFLKEKGQGIDQVLRNNVNDRFMHVNLSISGVEQNLALLRGTVGANRAELQATLAALQQQVDQITNDQNIARYAFYAFQEVPREWYYHGQDGMQVATAESPLMGNVGCEETREHINGMPYATHKAVICVLPLTFDHQRPLTIAWKGRYPMVSGNGNVRMFPIEDGMIWTNIRPLLSWQNLDTQKSRDLLNVVTDPQNYKRAVRLYAHLPAVTSDSISTSSNTGVEGTAVKPALSIDGANSALLLGNDGSASTVVGGKANTNQSGDRNISFKIGNTGGQDISLNVARPGEQAK